MLYYNRDKLDIIMKIHIVNNLSCVWMDMSNVDYALWRGFQRQVCYLDAMMVDARSPFTGPIFYCTSLLLMLHYCMALLYNGCKLKVRCSLQITIYKVVQFRPIYNTVNPVYKEHLREPENVPFMSSCP